MNNDNLTGVSLILKYVFLLQNSLKYIPIYSLQMENIPALNLLKKWQSRNVNFVIFLYLSFYVKLILAILNKASKIF
jgi:hypothetical protein